MIKIKLSFFVLLFIGSSAIAQKAHQFECIADSRKPNTEQWWPKSDMVKQNPRLPSTFGIAYTRMKENPNFRHGFRYEIGLGAYTSRYTFTQDIGSGPIYYDIERQVRSAYAECGYKLEWRLNTSKASELQQKGTYLQVHGGLGMFYFSAPGYIDKQAENALVEMREEQLIFPHGHLFLGLSQRFQFSDAGPVYYALAGIDGFLGAENGYYTQLNSRFGIGVQFGGSK